MRKILNFRKGKITLVKNACLWLYLRERDLPLASLLLSLLLDGVRQHFGPINLLLEIAFMTPFGIIDSALLNYLFAFKQVGRHSILGHAVVCLVLVVALLMHRNCFFHESFLCMPLLSKHLPLETCNKSFAVIV